MSPDLEFLVAGLPERVRRLEEKGSFKQAIRLVNEILVEKDELPSMLRSRLEWEPERVERVRADYGLSWDEAFETLKNWIAGLTRADFERWIEEGAIDHREIEGETRIFKRFIPNLLRESEEARKRTK